MAENLNDEKCAFEGCYTVDFLPINCNLCSKRFCTVHAVPDNHLCPSELAPDSQVKQNALDNARIPCSFSGCNTPTSFFVDGTNASQSCSDCGGVFCLAHRHAIQHNCINVTTSNASSGSTAQALAQKAIENSKASSSTNSAIKSNPRVQTPKMKAVELMKMQRKAKAANPRDNSAEIPMDQRFFAVVSYGSTEKTLWISNDVVAGKALDLFASKLGVLVSPLVLRSKGGEPLKMDLPLSLQVESPANLSIDRTVG